MKYFLRKSLFLILCCVICWNTAQSQQPSVQPLEVRGKIVDNNGAPLPRAAIVIRGTTKGASTDNSGNFVLRDVPSNAVLVVSYVGYETSYINVSGRTTINVTLQEEANVIDEVIVTGFKNVQKANFTGASVKLGTEDMKIKGVSDISRMLEGQIAGLSIQNVSGTFGAAPRVRIRGVASINGDNKPLWVIDGVVNEDMVNVSNDQLASGDPITMLGSGVAGLNANDIESIDVLKDASATALYGGRAMNGVIVITTKRGRSGRPVVTYSGNYSYQPRPSYSNFDIMNSADQMSVYAQLEREGFLNTNILNSSNWGVYGKMWNEVYTFDDKTGKFNLENTPEARKEYLMKYARANTNWFKILFKNSLIQEHSVAISSGNENTKNYASLSFLNDAGYSIADKVNRYTLNMRNDNQLSEKVNLSFSTMASLRRQEAPGTLSRRTDVVHGSYDRDFDINPYSYALNTSRTMRAYDDEGNLEYFQRNFAPFNIINELDNNHITLTAIDIKAQIDAGYKFSKAFKWEFVGAVRYMKSDREHQIKEGSNMAEAYRAAGNSTVRSLNKYLYKDPDNPNAEAVVVLPYGGFYNRQEDQMMHYNIRNSIVFSKTFGTNDQHYVNAIFGQEIKYTNRQNFSNTGYGYQYDQGGIPFVDYKIMKQMIESNFDYYAMSKTRERFMGFYANADYSLYGKYVFSATTRIDGSNALGKNASARWLPIWNVSAKWNADKEEFLQDLSWLSYLSLRTSYGLTANMPPTANASDVYYVGKTRRNRADDIESRIYLDDIANYDLTWEKAYALNVGMDAAFFGRRIDLSIDYWKRNSFDLIASIQTSGIGGQGWKYANYADMSGSGWDFSLGVTWIRARDFNYKTTFIAGFDRSKITKSKYMPRIWDLINQNGGNLEGYAAKSLFSIKFEGLDSNGIPTFIDENGKLSNTVYFQSTNIGNLKYEGQINPKYTGGISNTFRYKDLSLNVFVTFQGGNKIRLDAAFKEQYNDLDALSNTFYSRWLMPGDEKVTSIPSIADRLIIQQNLGSAYPYGAYNYSTARVVDGDFMRFKTVSLSYNVPERYLKKLSSISKVSLTLAGSNLFLIYSDRRLNGQDPEFFNSGGVAQPIQKQYTLALSIGF